MRMRFTTIFPRLRSVSIFESSYELRAALGSLSAWPEFAGALEVYDVAVETIFGIIRITKRSD